MRRILRLLAVGFTSVLVVSCATTGVLLPAISPEIEAKGAAKGVSRQDLAKGRELMAYRCGSCHRLPAVDRHSYEEWEDIVADMRDRSNLTPDEERKLMAYLQTVVP